MRHSCKRRSRLRQIITNLCSQLSALEEVWKKLIKNETQQLSLRFSIFLHYVLFIIYLFNFYVTHLSYRVALGHLQVIPIQFLDSWITIFIYIYIDFILFLACHWLPFFIVILFLIVTVSSTHLLKSAHHFTFHLSLFCLEEDWSEWI